MLLKRKKEVRMVDMIELVNICGKMFDPEKTRVLNLDKYGLSNIPINILKLTKLESLSICYNKIKNIDILFGLPNLKKLYCYANRITSINYLPLSLELLDCGRNNIISIDNLPFGLKYLDCEKNKIKKIENLPIFLECLFSGVSEKILPPFINVFN